LKADHPVHVLSLFDLRPDVATAGERDLSVGLVASI
jgi:hypothetical protein